MDPRHSRLASILPEVTPVSLDRAPGILAAMAAGTARGRTAITF